MASIVENEIFEAGLAEVACNYYSTNFIPNAFYENKVFKKGWETPDWLEHKLIMGKVLFDVDAFLKDLAGGKLRYENASIIYDRDPEIEKHTGLAKAHIAIAAGDNRALMKCLETWGHKDLNIQAYDHRGDRLGTPLILACRLGRAKAVGQLIRKGAEIEFADSQGTFWEAVPGVDGAPDNYILVPAKNVEDLKRPLHFAVTSGDLETVKILVEAGANINAKTGPLNPKLTPLLMALEAQKPNTEIVSYLLKKGADPNIVATEVLDAFDVEPGERHGKIDFTALDKLNGAKMLTEEQIHARQIILDAGGKTASALKMNKGMGFVSRAAQRLGQKFCQHQLEYSKAEPQTKTQMMVRDMLLNATHKIRNCLNLV